MRLKKAERKQVLLKYSRHCAYCGALLGERWHADHMEALGCEPERMNGHYTGAMVMGRPANHAIDNMMPAFVPCNLSKVAREV